MALDFDYHEMESIKRNERRVEDCCRTVMQRWLQGGHKAPVSWETLIASLEDASLNNLAKDIQETLDPVVT